jgi:hypothetical protein
MSGKEITETLPGPIFAGSKTPTQTRIVFDCSNDAATFTCDAPLCDEHAVQGDVWFDLEPGEVTVEDYCWTHPKQNHGGIKPIFAWQANRLRMAHRLKSALRVERRRNERWLD